jgi:thiamine biosynthesis lipoprotein
MRSFRSTVEPVLGTRLTMRVDAPDRPVADAAEAVVLGEAERLEALLSTYRAESAMSRWRRGRLDDPGPEVVAVLAVAARWTELTPGAFSPCLGALMRRWRRAEAEQRLPDPRELAALAAAATLPYALTDTGVTRIGDCTLVDVHGVAKGWVIDRLVDAAVAVAGVGAVLVDLGGDLRHARRDEESDVTVAIEDPGAVADNATPLAVVRLAEQAVATSGGGRRGWRIGGRWYGHLLDPATGWPLAGGRSATAIAPTAADADAAASAAVVGGLGVLDGSGIAALVVAEDQHVARNARWRATVDERQ